jgi:hypothetical protein
VDYFVLNVPTSKGGLIESYPKSSVEFLPVAVEDHRGTVIGPDYAIANVDKERSDFDMQTIIKDQVSDFRVLALDERRIPKDAKLFRLAEKTRLIIAREDLARSIIDQGCIGARFRVSTEFGSEIRE